MKNHTKLFLITFVVILLGLFAGKTEVKAAYCGVDKGMEGSVGVNAKICFKQWNGFYTCINNGPWGCNGTWSCDTGGTLGPPCAVVGISGISPNTCYVTVRATQVWPNYYNGCNIPADLMTCTETRPTETAGCWVYDTPTPPPTSTPTPTPPSGPSCTLSLTSIPTTISVGGISALTAIVTPTNGTISKVDFYSNNGNTSVSPATDTISPYTSTATGVSNGSSIVTATATMNDGTTTCTSNSTININSNEAWWQVKDGDVSTNGDLYYTK